MNAPGRRLPPLDLWKAAGHGFQRLFQSAPLADVVRVDGGMLALTGVAVADLNCGIVWATDGADAVTVRLADELRGRGLPGILLVADPVDGGGIVDAGDHGLIAAARMPLMTRGSGALPAGSFGVRTARSAGDLAASNRLVAAAFEVPVTDIDDAFRPSILDAADVAVELVFDGEEPVGSLQTTSREGLIGIWSMATPPAHRRRGVARSGLSNVLGRHFAAGGQSAYLIATESGRPLYDSMGFEIVAWCSAWAVIPADAAP